MLDIPTELIDIAEAKGPLTKGIFNYELLSSGTAGN